VTGKRTKLKFCWDVTSCEIVDNVSVFHRNWLAASKIIIQKVAAPGAASRAHQDPIFCPLRFLCFFILASFITFRQHVHIFPIYNPALTRVTRSQARHSIASTIHLVPPIDLTFTLKVNLAASSKTLANIYQTTQHEPDNTA